MSVKLQVEVLRNELCLAPHWNVQSEKSSHTDTYTLNPRRALVSSTELRGASCVESEATTADKCSMASTQWGIYSTSHHHACEHIVHVVPILVYV